jgi:predicted phosphodiesterase
MRIAAIGDVHGNLPALEAVMEEINEENVDGIVVCGDTIAGPLPTETLALLQESRIPVHFLRGNHDSDVVRFLSGQEPGGMVAKDDDAARWEAGKLTREQKASLLTWPATVEMQLDPWGKALFCHATPCSDTHVFSGLTPDEVVMPVFGGLDASLVVCAHTHMQFDRVIAGVRVVNTGSLGMCVGRTGADWLLIDDGIRFRHTDFDLDQASERIRQSDYPKVEDFVQNRVLQVAPESRMFEIIDHYEALQARAIT